MVTFLKQLLRAIPGKLLLIWDRTSIHRSQAVKAFLKAGAAERIHLEMLPPYSPQLNPDEQVWGYLKKVELKNVITANLAYLDWELHKTVLRLKRKPQIIQTFFRHAGCQL